MKIYVGKNKKEAKEISLKSLLTELLCNDLDNVEIEADRFNDDSASWININQINEKDRVSIDIVVGFDPEDDNQFEGIRVWTTPIKTIIDHDETKKLV